MCLCVWLLIFRFPCLDVCLCLAYPPLCLGSWLLSASFCLSLHVPISECLSVSSLPVYLCVSLYRSLCVWVSCVSWSLFSALLYVTLSPWTCVSPLLRGVCLCSSGSLVCLFVSLSPRLCLYVPRWVWVSLPLSLVLGPRAHGGRAPLPELSPVRARREGPGQRDAGRRLRLGSLRARGGGGGGGRRRAGAMSPPPALPLGRAASAGRSRRRATGAASAAGGLR